MRLFASVFVGLLVLGVSSAAVAQDDPRGQAPSDASSPNEVAQPDEVPRDDDATLETATPDPTPQVPSVLQRPMSEADVRQVSRDANALSNVEVNLHCRCRSLHEEGCEFRGL